MAEEENFWGMFCGGGGLVDLTCIDHALPIGLDVLLLVIYIAFLFGRPSSSRSSIRAFSVSALQLISALLNGFLGLIYIGIGIWMGLNVWGKSHRVLPLHTWILLLFHGVTWLTVSVTVSLDGKFIPFVVVLSILASFLSGINCGFSIVTSIMHSKFSFKLALDILSLLGSALLAFCAYRAWKHGDDDKQNDLYTPLIDKSDEKERSDYVHTVTPFYRAGIFSKMTFSWLNELMKRGKAKTFDQNDIPLLRPEDRAESCYLMFTELVNKQQKQVDSGVQVQRSLLKTIVLCHSKEIIISGFFAFLKTITLSASPLLLNAFIKVAGGKENFKYEGYVLAILLFSSKTLESCSQRQWYFRSRVIGFDEP